MKLTKENAIRLFMDNYGVAMGENPLKVFDKYRYTDDDFIEVLDENKEAILESDCIEKEVEEYVKSYIQAEYYVNVNLLERVSQIEFMSEDMKEYCLNDSEDILDIAKNILEYVMILDSKIYLGLL